MTTDHDPGYKRLFSHPAMIHDLLRGFVAEPWIEELDFSTLEKYPTVFVSDRLRERRDDLIWRLRWGPHAGSISICCWNFNPLSTASWRCG